MTHPAGNPALGRIFSAPAQAALAAAAVLSGAFLLFLIQPVVGKIVTPQYGGVAQVWCVCLLFFQITLLGGYGLSYGLSRLSLKMQALAYLALMAMTAFTIHIPLGEAWAPSDWRHPIPSLLGNLTLALAAPCMLLATVSATMQNWFARLRLGNPYPLYALSNVGSLGALITYPTLIEPNQTLRQTLWLFQGGYWLLAALASAMALIVVWRAHVAKAAVQTSDKASDEASDLMEGPVSWRNIGGWLGLSAMGVVLFMTFTSHVTHQIAPIPLLWIVPLGLYLLSFIVCFGQPAVYRRLLWIVLAYVFLIVFLFGNFSALTTLSLGALALFALCMICHGELYARRPAPARLTLFYLCLAIGGAFGGAFVSLAAPLLFKGSQEFFLSLFAMALLTLYLLTGPRSPELSAWRAVAMKTAAAGVIVLLTLVLFAPAQMQRQAHRQLVLEDRNFYGAASVTLNRAENVLELANGRVRHGRQRFDKTTRRFLMTPTAYYDVHSALGLTESFLRAHRHGAPLRMGAIGLGVGTIAAYGRPGDALTFYEIDPKILRIATQTFGFLKNTRAQAQVILGDGRLSLQKQPPQQYDLLLVDAFSGDAIPIHLLTREAMRLYWRHLRPDGVLLIHISNQYLDLTPQLHVMAIDQRLRSLMIRTPGEDGLTTYAVLTRAPWLIDRLLSPAALKAHPRLEYVAQRPFAGVRAWTDDFSDPLSAVRIN